jgi:hypothetical protein
MKIIDFEVYFDAADQIEKLDNLGFKKTNKYYPTEAYVKFHGDIQIIAYNKYDLLRIYVSENTEGRIVTWDESKEYTIGEVLGIINVKELSELFNVEPKSIYFKSLENRTQELKSSGWKNEYIENAFLKEGKHYTKPYDTSYYWFTDDKPQNTDNYIEELKRLGFLL